MYLSILGFVFALVLKAPASEFIFMNFELVFKTVVAQRGARTHDPEIKSLMLYRLS